MIPSLTVEEAKKSRKWLNTIICYPLKIFLIGLAMMFQFYATQQNTKILLKVLTVNGSIFALMWDIQELQGYKPEKILNSNEP